MMRYLLIILLFAVTSQVKIFLFGGILSYEDDNPAYQEIIKATGIIPQPNCQPNWEITKCAKVAVITSACEDSKCGEEQYYFGDDEEAPTGEFFQKLGASTKHINVHVDNYRDATNVLTETGYSNYVKITQADIIYFNGGDQSRHARCWFNDDGTPNSIFSVIKKRALNNELVIVGVSAGTAVQSQITYGGGSAHGILYFSNIVGLAPNQISDGAIAGKGLNDLRNGSDCLQSSENGAKVTGFGLETDFQIDTHFDRRGRLGRLVPVMAQLKSPIGIGIDQETCFYYNNGVGTVYGVNGVFIVDITEAVKVSAHYFQMKNVKVHYLTQGDSFTFKTKSLATSKSLIANYEFSGYQDSDSILSKYECTRLITRLVDQKGVYNLGKTKIPEDEEYPAQTPKFDFIFYRNSDTKGYKSNGKYTAVNVYLDISAQTRNSYSLVRQS